MFMIYDIPENKMLILFLERIDCCLEKTRWKNLDNVELFSSMSADAKINLSFPKQKTPETQLLDT